MPFPDAPKTIYGKNPLDQVICQLRFPPILKIDANSPHEFQDKIRNVFPYYSGTVELKIELPPEIAERVPAEILSQLGQFPGGKNHEFLSEDEVWKINLTRTFIALSTTKYERWSHFKEKLKIPLDALLEIYSPAFFSRVGLRYVDVIKRSVLGLTDAKWDDLLERHTTGILSSDVGDYVQGFVSRYEIGLEDDKSIVRIITQMVNSVDDGEPCYMIDIDFFNTEKNDAATALEKLDYFSVRGSRLFRWCITDRLHEAMEPHTP